jgi:TonB family protein
MQQILFALCTLLLLADLAVGQPDQNVGGVGPGPNWRTYTVKGEEFSVTLPAVPEMRTTDGFRKDGKTRLERRLKTSLYNVDYSIEAFENPEPRQSLQKFIEEFGFDTEYDRQTRRKWTVDGFEGFEYSLANRTAVIRFVATEAHLYRFIATGTIAVKGSEVERFFSLIRLGQNLDGIQISDGPGGSLPAGAEVYSGKQATTKARLLSKPQPSYTKEARENDISGVVILKCVFRSNGEVTNIHIVAGLPYGLTDRAIEAAKKIKFIPATKDGQPVSMWMQLEYHFSP